MNQSTQLHDIPKDTMSNPEEMRALQDLIDQNVDEAGYGGPEQDFGVDQAYAQQQQQQAAYQTQAPHLDSGVQLQNQMGIGLQQPMPPLQPGMMPEQQQNMIPIQPQFGGYQGGPPPYQGGPPQRGMQFRGNGQFEGPPHQPESEDWSEFILREFKDSLVVMILVVLFNFNFVENALQQYIPYMDNNYLSLVAKGVIAGAAFYGVKKLWR